MTMLSSSHRAPAVFSVILSGLIDPFPTPILPAFISFETDRRAPEECGFLRENEKTGLPALSLRTPGACADPQPPVHPLAGPSPRTARGGSRRRVPARVPPASVLSGRAVSAASVWTGSNRRWGDAKSMRGLLNGLGGRSRVQGREGSNRVRSVLSICTTLPSCTVTWTTP